MSEASEKTSPIVPAVEGIIINNLEDSPKPLIPVICAPFLEVCQ
jgi:hypothetical protein